MFEFGDWVIITETHDVFTAGEIYKVQDHQRFRGPDWVVSKDNGQHVYVLNEGRAKRLDTYEIYIIVYFEKNQGTNRWEGPYKLTYHQIDRFRNEVRELENSPLIFNIVAKKKITVPYEHPDGEAPPVPAPNPNEAVVGQRIGAQPVFFRAAGRPIGGALGAVNVAGLGQAGNHPAAVHEIEVEEEQPDVDWDAIENDDEEEEED